ncbi:MAG: hypothetical protein IH876_11155 [Gemmatimonadetes bacterium]|nr:hypothetical protein [Gemmatimonadota bacterium]
MRALRLVLLITALFMLAEVAGGVSNVHDLHVWTVTSGVVAMSGHVVVGDPAINQRVLEAARRRLEALGIGHITMQIEQERICNEMAHV